MRALARYELVDHADQDFATLSGGQQARLLILMLEIGGATLLLLDEPTDNLDVHSADALERGLDDFEGTVIAVTHDRWFARRFNRFSRPVGGWRRDRPAIAGVGVGVEDGASRIDASRQPVTALTARLALCIVERNENALPASMPPNKISHTPKTIVSATNEMAGTTTTIAPAITPKIP